MAGVFQAGADRRNEMQSKRDTHEISKALISQA
jgi:hypothetical protein